MRSGCPGEWSGLFVVARAEISPLALLLTEPLYSSLSESAPGDLSRAMKFSWNVSGRVSCGSGARDDDDDDVMECTVSMNVDATKNVMSITAMVVVHVIRYFFRDIRSCVLYCVCVCVCTVVYKRFGCGVFVFYRIRRSQGCVIYSTRHSLYTDVC